MDRFKILKTFEEFYDQIVPARQKSDQAFVWLSGIPHPLFNAVMHLSCENVREEVDALINECPRDIPMSFWVHAECHSKGLKSILEEKGFKAWITCPLMIGVVKGALDPLSVDIRYADERFYQIVSKVYEFDAEVDKGFQEIMENVSCENYVIYEENKPVGTASLFVNGKVGGIFNDATLPGRREASYSLMNHMMQRAYELKLERVIVLSSPEGEELYTSLGFRNVLDIEIYCP